VNLNTAGTELESYRYQTGNPAGAYISTQVVTFDSGGDENVLRGNFSQVLAEGDKDITLSPAVTNLASSTAWTPTQSIYINGALPGLEDTDQGDSMAALVLTAENTLNLKHDTSGGEADNVWEWEVIEWDTSAASATRRVMVIG
jgi:hypothetical protein